MQPCVLPAYLLPSALLARESVQPASGGLSSADFDAWLWVQFIFLFGSTIVAAVCTMLLRSLPTHRVSEEQQKQGFHGAARRCWLQVRDASVIFTAVKQAHRSISKASSQ